VGLTDVKGISSPFPVVAASGNEIVVKDLPIEHATLALEKYALKIHNYNLTYNISIHFFSLKSPA